MRWTLDDVLSSNIRRRQVTSQGAIQRDIRGCKVRVDTAASNIRQALPVSRFPISCFCFCHEQQGD